MSAKKCDQAPRYYATAERVRLAHQIQAWRLAKGMSKRELNRRSGLPVSALTRLEEARSDPLYSTLIRICRGIGITLHQLHDGKPKEYAKSIAHDDRLWHSMAERDEKNDPSHRRRAHA